MTTDPTPAQEEFAALVDNNNRSDPDRRVHPEDRHRDHRDHDGARHSGDEEEADEEDRFRAAQIDAAMRMPTTMMDSRNSGGIRLPPASFDRGRATGVKGVIADARAYETARRSNSKWRDRVRAARRSVFGGGLLGVEARGGGSEPDSGSDLDGDGDGVADPDEAAFLEQWRESRRRELEQESRNPVRNRRTSPSVRLYGRFEQVDALGYLDAIEKVGRETVVVVFVYDHECDVSAAIESALVPLVTTYPAVRFVKVHYEDIEFDNAGVPAILAYRNQGDLFANLTGILEMIPDDDDFDTGALRKLFVKQGIL